MKKLSWVTLFLDAHAEHIEEIEEFFQRHTIVIVGIEKVIENVELIARNVRRNVKVIEL